MSPQWLHRLLARISTPRPVRSTRRRPRVQLQVEGLERRLLMTVSVTLQNRTVLAIGDDAPNTFQLSDSGAVTTVNGLQFADTAFDSVQITTGNGNDTVQILSNTKPTTVHAGRGTDAINIGDPGQLLGAAAPITVNSDNGGMKTLNYNDQANPTAGLTYQLFANPAGSTSGVVRRNGLGDVSYNNISNLVVNTARPANQTVNIVSTAAATATTVNDDGAGDTINVGLSDQLLVLSSPLTVNEHGSTPGLLAYNDQFNPSMALTYTLSGTGTAGRLQRNGLADVSFNGISDVELITGARGNQTINVLSTAPTPLGTQIYGGQGNDTINVGNSAAVLDLPYALTINEPTQGTKVLNYNDQANPTPALTYTLTGGGSGSGRVERNGLAPLGYTGITSLAVNTGTVGNQTINVASTSANVSTTVKGGHGNDTMNIGNSNSQLNLSGMLTVQEQGGGTKTLNYNDQFNSSGSLTYTLSVGSSGGLVQRNGLANLVYAGIDAVAVNTGAGSNQTVNVWSTPATTSTTVHGGRGLNAVNFGFYGDVRGIAGPVTILGAASISQVQVYDAGDSGNRSVTVNSTGITGLAPAALSFTAASVGTLTVSGGSGSNTYTIAGTPASTGMTLDTGSKADAVMVQGNSSPLTIQKGYGSATSVDMVTLGNAGSLAGITAPVSILNSVSSDQALVDDSADAANHPGVLIGANSITGLAPAALNFTLTSINTLTVLGGGGNNAYLITNVSPYTSATLNPGGGIDTISVQANSGRLTIDSGAGSGADTITLGGAPNGLSLIRAAVIVTAAATDSLVLSDQGFTGARTFTVTNTTVSWGGLTLTYSGLGSLTIEGGSGGTTFIVLASSATAALTLDGQGATDTLAGSDAGNLFAIAGSDSGTLSGSAYAGTVTFNQVGNLTAGQGGDSFQFADQATLSGSILGSGLDTLDYTAYSTSIVVDLQTAFATGVGGAISGILNVNGGTGGAAGTYNLLIGAGGNTLTGGTGRRNLLVAGGSASTLNGGDQEDLLIAGSTIYDTEAGLASWLAIASYWAGTDDYFTRVANLTAGTGVPLLDATTVIGNGGGNVLNGNGALALIFSDGLDSIAGFDPNSQTVAINP